MSNIKFVTCEITDKCNLRCKHCYLSGKEIGKDLSTRSWLKIIDLLSEQGIEHITISGGEPLLRKDLEKLIKRCKKNNIFCVITTNGIFLNKDRVKQLKKAGVDFVQLSFEGSQKYHDFIRGEGNYKKVLKAIDLLLVENINFGTMTTLTNKNCSRVAIKNIVDNLVGLGVRKISFEKYLYTNKNIADLSLNKMQIKSLYRYLSSLEYGDVKLNINDPLRCLVKKNNGQYFHGGCLAGKYVCAVASNGDIKLCTKIPLVFGNILKDRLKDLSKNEIVKKIINRDFDNDCGVCKKKWQCGGCRAEAFFRKGDILAKDDFCWS